MLPIPSPRGHFLLQNVNMAIGVCPALLCGTCEKKGLSPAGVRSGRSLSTVRLSPSNSGSYPNASIIVRPPGASLPCCLVLSKSTARACKCSSDAAQCSLTQHSEVKEALFQPAL